MDIIFQIGLFILGGFAVLIYQRFQSKEVLKQTLYKEKLVLYKQVVKCVTNVNVVIANHIDEKRDDEKELNATLNVLRWLIMHNLHLFTDEIIDILFNFTSDVQNAKTINDYKNLGYLNFYFEIVKETKQ